MLTAVAIMFAASSLIAGGKPVVKKAKAKQATCTSCPKGQKCAKATCTKADCCK